MAPAAGQSQHAGLSPQRGDDRSRRGNCFFFMIRRPPKITQRTCVRSPLVLPLHSGNTSQEQSISGVYAVNKQMLRISILRRRVVEYLSTEGSWPQWTASRCLQSNTARRSERELSASHGRLFSGPISSNHRLGFSMLLGNASPAQSFGIFQQTRNWLPGKF